LSVSADKTGFEFKGKKVFLSGANQPWINYGNDFGNAQPNGQVCDLQSYVKNVSAAGGNSLRMWLFVEGDSIPMFDPTGHVTGTDSANTLAEELKVYLRYAAAHNVFVNLCLWNGAVLRNPQAIDLMSGTNDTDGSKLASYIDNALVPLVTALKGEPGLGAWELMNEPEGSLTLAVDKVEPCWDTQTNLANTGAGWAGHRFTMKQIQRFFAVQAAAIHKADPKALVTVGSWSQHTVTAAFPYTNGQGYYSYYSDACLAKASNATTAASSAAASVASASSAVAGAAGANLDFAQIHQYPDHDAGTAALNKSMPYSPFVLSASQFKAGKPVVLGEFATSKCKGGSSGCTPASLYKYAHQKGFAGAWDWSLIGGGGTDDEVDAVAGMRTLKGLPDVVVSTGLAPPPDTCSCSDVAPAGSSATCAQQSSWGKCDTTANPWMKGFCCRSCLACKGCK
jgi:mannan endo-1,4-beta-mannosidase